MAMDAVKDIMNEDDDFWRIEGDCSSLVFGLKVLMDDIEKIESDRIKQEVKS
jgi:hypothetical protein